MQKNWKYKRRLRRPLVGWPRRALRFTFWQNTGVLALLSIQGALTIGVDPPPWDPFPALSRPPLPNTYLIMAFGAFLKIEGYLLYRILFVFCQIST